MGAVRVERDNSGFRFYRFTQEQTEFGAFFDVEKMIRAAVADLKNITVIPGFDFVPHDTDYYADIRLHPNDEGAAH